MLPRLRVGNRPPRCSSGPPMTPSHREQLACHGAGQRPPRRKGALRSCQFPGQPGLRPRRRLPTSRWWAWRC